MEKFLEILKSFFGDDLKEEDITKAEGIEEDAQKAIGDALEVIDEYRDDYTPDVLGAIQMVAKIAVTPPEEVEEPDFVAELTDLEKAGARLSKATIAQLKKIVEIASNMLAASEKKLGKKTDDDKVSPEVLELREKLKAYKDAEDLKKQEKKDQETEDLKERVAELEKNQKEPPVKKGLKGQDGDDDPEEKDKKDGDDKKEAQWPSLCKQEKEEE